MSMQALAIFFLVAVAMGGVAWVFIYPSLSGERQAEQRIGNIAKSDPVVRATSARTNQKVRREQVELALEELEARRKQLKSPPLTLRISHAGLSWSKQRFFVICAVLGVVAFVAGLVIGGGLLAALGFAFAGAFGVPFWMLRFLKKRREKAFLEHFPDAVDVIVRGIKAGLPLTDSLRVIATDAPEPVRSEFRAIVDTQTIGIPLGEACARLYESMPVSEANFFGIVVSIQQKSGGNLSEALGNLARVLRDRKRMKGKIDAMSMEAKASAAIIAALPIAVMVLVYLTSPGYISLLWTTPTGKLMLAGSAFWMTSGILVMRKMINFDF
ncbi:MAG TPA: type II secretion system F family protein [Xanthobacteraceae bacterium]|jgi:tight adherence protein B|nr:type II secretion system F family protein [Xanthobacteraceae bacterium]